jgi:hypothetical protein
MGHGGSGTESWIGSEFLPCPILSALFAERVGTHFQSRYDTDKPQCPQSFTDSCEPLYSCTGLMRPY